MDQTNARSESDGWILKIVSSTLPDVHANPDLQRHDPLYSLIIPGDTGSIMVGRSEESYEEPLWVEKPQSSASSEEF